MATMMDKNGGRRIGSLAPDTYERVLGIGAILLFAAAAIAIVRGRGEWATVPLLVWLHLGTIMIALVLTPVMLLRPRGDTPHRLLGTIWVAAMLLTAALTFGIRLSRHGGFSVIHILSVWVLIQVPIMWWAARRHHLARHRGAARGLVTGALLIAGFFTFPFDRLLGHWLFG